MGRKGKWDCKSCTIDDGPTDAYGKMVFPGASDVPSHVTIIRSFKLEVTVVDDIVHCF